MLFKNATLDLIKQNKVDIAFRKWTRPTVRSGGRLNTPIGQLKILSLSTIDPDSITHKDVLRAGYTTYGQLAEVLGQKAQGHVYRIEFMLAGPDPRISLRNQIDLSFDELLEVEKYLRRLDQSKKYGAWTWKVMEIIQQYPERKASDLADMLDMEKMWLKTNIRKLKGLGLTISMGTGYHISPRGKIYMNFVRDKYVE